MNLTSPLRAAKGVLAVLLSCPEPCFISISALVSQKVETTRGVPLEFSPFCNPLSLTPLASQTLMTKSWYCQELCKKLSNAYSKSDDGEGKIPNLIITPIIRALDRKQKFDKTHPRGANQGVIRKGDFKRGEP